MRARVRSEASTRVDGNSSVELDDADWEAAKQAWFREGTIPAVARALGSTNETAERVVMVGSLGRGPLRLEGRAELAVASRARPLLPEDEAKLSQAAKRASKEILAKEKAILGDASESREEELRLVRSNRRGAIVLASLNVKLLRAADAIASSLMMDLVAEDAEGRAVPTPKTMALAPRERLGLVRAVAQIVQRAAEASSKSVQMERLLLGEPTAILAHQTESPTDDMTPEEAEKWIELGHRALQRRARRRTVVEALPASDDLPALLPEDL